jgi:exopolysaccharide biosynthesis predicted pyruvyltransferase EpsI
MDARTAVEMMRGRVEATLRPLVGSADTIALIDFPNTANVGDSAIYVGQLACLASLGAPRPRFICDLRTYDRGELARRIGSSGVILFAGGGNFGDVWPATQELREDIVRSFPGNPIIQLPQTIHFERDDSLRRARTVYDAHPNLTVLARDRRSLTIARREFRARSLLCPDVAFALGPLARPRPATRLLLWLLRTDKETRGGAPPSRVSSVDWLDEPPMPLRELSYRLVGATRRRGLSRIARPLLMRVYGRLARQRLRRGLEMLASAEVVVTDRMHGHILCLLLGIPHVLLDNNYGKLSSFYETWTVEVDNVRWAGSAAEAARLAGELTRIAPPQAVIAEGARG